MVSYIDLDMPIRGRCREWLRRNVALSFDGVDDYVLVSDSPTLRFGAEHSFEVWLRMKKVASVRIFAKIETDADREVDFHTLTDNTLRIFYQKTGTSIASVDSLTKLEVGKWYQVVGTYDYPGDVEIYVNGAFEAKDTTGDEPYDSTRPLYLGCYQPASGHGALDIALLRIYSRALTAYEVEYNHEHIFEPYSVEGLVAWLPMDEVRGTRCFDVSGYGNHGSIYGAGWVDEVDVRDL